MHALRNEVCSLCIFIARTLNEWHSSALHISAHVLMLRESHASPQLSLDLSFVLFSRQNNYAGSDLLVLMFPSNLLRHFPTSLFSQGLRRATTAVPLPPCRKFHVNCSELTSLATPVCLEPKTGDVQSPARYILSGTNLRLSTPH